MDKRLVNFLLLGAVSLWAVLPAAVLSDPILVDFNQCNNATYQLRPGDNTVQSLQCCPIPYTDNTTIISGVPPPSTNYTRVRLASQCTDAAYAQKLDRAYALMRDLPEGDPRSFKEQWKLHCSYCGAAFYLKNSTGDPTPGIDIHFSWLFYPWHRYFLLFHERILQFLLEDPTFSLNYWNWDSPFTVGGGSPTSSSCKTVGHNFPSAYSSSTSSAYDDSRSDAAKGNRGFKFPDLQYSPFSTPENQGNYNLTEQELIYSNLGVMRQAMVTGGTTASTFMGRPYQPGDDRGFPDQGNVTGGGGSLENTAHAGAHFWTGKEFPVNEDMGVLAYSARDPVFFSHHSNIDRLWQVWKDIGPQLNQDRQYFDDPDFLNSEFQFYDENMALRKVKVSDSLDTTKLGYVYQETNDAAWLDYRPSRCSNVSYAETIRQAQALPVPTADASGNYRLQANTPFVQVVTQPASNGADVFLTVDGINFNRSLDTGFDVYLDWLNPQTSNSSASCSEYAGRFTNMASGQGRFGPQTDIQMTWTQCISSVLTAVGVPQPGPSSVAVTLMPTSAEAADVLTFTSISIGPSSG